MSDASRPLGPGGALPGGSVGQYGDVDDFMRTSFLHDAQNESQRSGATMFHLSCTALSIGEWSCENEVENDLIIFYSLETRCITYYIGNGYRQQQPPVEYKIVYPFSHIKKFEVQQNETTDPTSTETSRISIELNQFPKFFETQNEDGCISFKQCRDFTDRQASLTKVHYLYGQHSLLTRQMARLLSFMSSLYGPSIPRSVNDSSVTMAWSLDKPRGIIPRATSSMLGPSAVLGATAAMLAATSSPATSVCEGSEYSLSAQSVSQLSLRELRSKSQASSSLGLQTDRRTIEGEVPFTDSGYASDPKLRRQSSSRSIKTPNRASEEPDNVQYEHDEDDARTSYSAATTINHDARIYISELCNDIYNKVLIHIDVKQWPTISQVLPDVIKAFAIRIGHSGSSPLSWDIMYFIHKRNKHIAAQLEDMFRHESNEMVDEHNTRDPEGMSVQDKMNLWSKTLQIDDVKTDNTEFFQGVPEEKEEDDDNMMDFVDPKGYRQAIRDSPAYNWFIATLQKECSIQQSDAAPSAMHNVRQEVLKWLPSGRLSKARAPQVHRATFRVDFRPDLEEDFCVSSERIITCTEGEVQATTSSDYCEHLWPFGGLDVLNVIQRAIDHRSTEPNGISYIGWSVLGDKTVVAAAASSNGLLVTVEGSAFAVAECGEQLACLAPILGLPKTARIVQGMPCIEPAKFPYLDVLASLDPSSEEYLTMSFLISIEDCSIREGWPCEGGTCMRSEELDLVAVVVLGYPTTRRPEQSLGLELPFSMLCPKFEAPETQCSTDVIRVQAANITLELVGQTSNVFYWHGLNSSEQPLRCALHAFKDDSGKLGHKHIRESHLSAARHIICDFEDELLKHKKHKTTSSSHRLLPFPELAADNSEEPVASSPASGVLDLDLLSISSASKPLDLENKRHTGYRVFVQVLYRLSLLCHTKTNNDGDSNYREKRGTQNKQKGSSSLTVKNGGVVSSQRQKRPRGNSDNTRDSGDDGDGDGDGRRPRKRAVRQTDCQSSPPFLACPFWKLDPQKHVECFFRRLDTISRVKQHLVRRHTPEYYCQLCYAKFSGPLDFDAHAVQATCVREPTARLEGISHPQRNQLSRKFQGSDEEKWYYMWDILFPDYERPASIYIDNSLSEDFCQIREICQREGIDILIEQLSANGLIRRPGTTDEMMHTTLQRAMDIIFDNYLLSRSSGPEQTQQSNLPTPNEPNCTPPSANPGTVGDSSTDSGVPTGSDPLSESHQSSSMLSSMASRNDLTFPQYNHEAQQPQEGGLRTTLSSTFGDVHIQNTEAGPSQASIHPGFQYQPINELRQDSREMSESRQMIDLLDALLDGVAEDEVFVYFDG